MSIRDKRVWHETFMPPLELPDRFAEATPAGIVNTVLRTKLLEYLGDFWEQADQGVAPVFLGPAGQYKTYAAAVATRFLHHNRIPVQFVQCGPFFMSLDANFFAQDGMRPYTQAVQVPFLVLDDFTQIKPGTRGVELLSNLVAERFAAKAPTLITGNIRGRDKLDGLRQIADQYRPDFARRLLHGAGNFYVTV